MLYVNIVSTQVEFSNQFHFISLLMPTLSLIWANEKTLICVHFLHKELIWILTYLNI